VYVRLQCFVIVLASLQAETIEFKALTEGVLEDRLRLAHRKVGERFHRLKALFEREGCLNLREQKVSGSKEPNLICTVEGSGASPRRILVGAHFDSAGGDGIIDNWTGAILLPSLAAFLREKPRKHSFEFIGFAAEERGLWGSRAYLKALNKEQREGVAAVLTMDSLGLTPTKFWPGSSSRELVLMAASVAAAMKLGFAGVNFDGVTASTDSMTFHSAGMPVLSLHSATQETFRLINSPKDVWKSVSWKDYYDSHRLVSALLVYLDQKLP
jgi:hypothetical protein